MSLSLKPHPLYVKQPLYDHLRLCTVRIVCSGNTGTGFFVSPGYVLTCAHVVEPAVRAKNFIEVYWNNQKVYYGQLKEFLSEPYPDLALLSVGITTPCVYLSEEIELNDDLYGYGYTKNDPNGVPATFSYEGSYGGPYPFLKFKRGNAEPGMSGGPLLNERTGYVCGMMKFTLGTRTLLGGGGIPARTIFEAFPRLQSSNQGFHNYDRRWEKIRRASMPPTEGESKLKIGKDALWHGEYDIARQELTEARRLINERELPKETAQVLYYLALALLDGMPPCTQGAAIIDSVERLMEAAISLHCSCSYMLVLAIFKDNFFRWNGFTHRLGEASELMGRARTIPRTSEDEDNLNLLKYCQPYLFQDYVDNLK